MNVLVAYATNAGSTGDVARAVANELEKRGASAAVLRVDEAAGVADYDAVIVGAPMIMGWHRAAAGFVKRHQDALSRVPVAYFLTAMSLTRTGDSRMGSTPIQIDPALAKPPRNDGRLSLRERYATFSNYVGPVLRTAPSIRPVSIGIFGGKLELFRLNLAQMLFVMAIVQAQPGDYRNWPFIREWAQSLIAGGLLSPR